MADRSDNLSSSPEGGNSGMVVEGMSCSGSLSLHAILEELPSEDDSVLNEGGRALAPLSRGHATR
jgi:hypothetical protein